MFSYFIISAPYVRDDVTTLRLSYFHHFLRWATVAYFIKHRQIFESLFDISFRVDKFMGLTSELWQLAFGYASFFPAKITQVF